MADDIEDDLDWLIGDDDHDKGKESKESNEEHSNGDHSRDKNSDDDVPENNMETDDEDDGLTPAERDILERNTLLNDASDREDYDLKDKVEKANADLESLKALDSSRETRVMFKKKLVEVEAPPPDYSSDSSSSSSSDSDHSSKNEEQAAQNKKIAFDLEDKRDDSEDVLVEKGGRFEWMSDTTGSEPEDNQSISSAKKEHPVRPRSAPIGKSKSQFQQPSPRERPSSASRSHEYSHIKSPYAMSPEMKELMRKRQAARAAREEEERAQERAREEQNRKNSEEAWKAWLERKDQEVMERKKKKQEEEEKKQLNYDPKQEADEAYQVWIKEKRKQRKKDRIEEQQRRLEVDEGWYRRDRKDCDLAYKRWLRQKQKESQSPKTTDKKHIQQSRADIYRMRQLQRLIMSIRTSQKR